ncbi:MAG: hypothetical protein ACLT98_05920 [Eggerthellaceae bacterium]
MERSFERARELGYDATVILGNPANYVSSGFVSCKKHNDMEDGASRGTIGQRARQGALETKDWTYRYSSVMDIDETEARRFDDTLISRKKMAAEPGGILHSRKCLL